MATHRSLMSSLPFLLLLLALVSNFASAAALPGRPRPVNSLSLPYIQLKNVENCSYTVIITTSCSSPNFTRDQISIAFGDANGNTVYAQRLDDLFSGTFTKCSVDNFQLEGPCTKRICYAYLYRTGSDGWMPEAVQIWSGASNATFYYGDYIPDDTWYGYNLCQWTSPPPPPPSYSSPPPPPFYYSSPPPPSYSSPPPPPPTYSSPPPPPPPYSSPPPPPPTYSSPPPPPPPSAANHQAAAWRWVTCLAFGVLAGAIF